MSNMGLRTRFIILFVVIIAISLMLYSAWSNYFQQKQAQKEMKEKAYALSQQLDAVGDVDPDISWVWQDPIEISEQERIDMNSKKASTAVMYLDRGVLSPEEVRDELTNDSYSGFDNLSGTPPPPQQPPEHVRTAENEGGVGEDPNDDRGRPTEDEAAEDADFDESKHPRDKKGQWTSGNSGGIKQPGGKTQNRAEAHHSMIYQGVTMPKDEAAKHEAARVENLTPAERTALKNYSIDEDVISSLNKRIRELGIDGLSSSDLHMVKGLDRLLEKASLKEPMIVFKGIRGDLVDDMEVGKIKPFSGFNSTSSNFDVAKGFSEKGSDPRMAVLRMKLPKGAPFVSIAEYSKKPEEREILGARGLMFKVSNIQEKNGLKIIDVEFDNKIGIEH
jgi:hypothetical protein